MKKPVKLILCTLISMSSILSITVGCAWYGNEHKTDEYEKQDFVMGTFITQKVYGTNAKRAANDVITKLRDVESKMTVNSPGGEINELNSQAGNEGVVVSKDTLYVLQKSKQYSKLSDGAFDVTIGPLIKAWGVSTDSPRIPESMEIKQLLNLVDYNSINIDSSSRCVQLKKGQAVDLGGIAKGFGGDEAIKIYRRYGIKSAFINLGGNVVVLNTKPDGTPWRIGIQNPRSANGEYIGIVDVENKAVVTSGDYQRFFEKDGKRYHHILDPKTGYPAQSGLISVTVVADMSIDADALSTSAFVMGLDRGFKLIQSIEEAEGIFITQDKNVYVTEGLKNFFTFTDESREFEYVKKR